MVYEFQVLYWQESHAQVTRIVLFIGIKRKFSDQAHPKFSQIVGLTISKKCIHRDHLKFSFLNIGFSPKASYGYGGKFGVQKDRMDKVWLACSCVHAKQNYENRGHLRLEV